VFADVSATVRASSLLAAALAAPVVVPGMLACHGTTKPRPGVARVLATTVLSPRMRDLTVASPALGETVKVRMLLPARYAARAEHRWPVLYLLHGCCDTYQSWTRSTDIEYLSAHSNVLVLMPEDDAANRGQVR
jgi:diacylglycerol O-acyltransferase / trehalose O-mycolyltransferase